MRIDKKKLKSIYFSGLLLLPLMSPPVAADPASADPDTMTLDEIARELSNPITPLASFDTSIQYSTFQGSLPDADDQSFLNVAFTASVPIPLKNGKNIRMRASIPVNGNIPVWQVPFGHPLWILDFDYPDYRLRQSPQITASTGEFASVHSGLGDISMDFAYGGVSDSGFISMYGFATVLETATNISASREQWLVGPEFAFGKQADWGVIGTWLTQLTNVDEGPNGYNTNETHVDIFFAYGLGNGWQVFSSPKVVYDWEAISGNQWLVPVGAGISKTSRFGQMPVKIAFEIQKYVVSPDRFGTDWLMTFSITPVLHNPFQK